ncbi:hypothetical protein ACFWQG_17760 [Rhodococcus sp. NPDC058532]
MLADIADATTPDAGTGSDAGTVLDLGMTVFGYVFKIATNAGGAGLS